MQCIMQGAEIQAIGSAVPEMVVENAELASLHGAEYVDRVMMMTGIRRRRMCAPATCASDLGLVATESVLKESGVARREVGGLIFVSQTPDYRMPATAPLLQSRLHLSTEAAAFDVNLGCSGYIYGLMLAFSHAVALQAPVLLLNAETRTKAYSIEDPGTGLLFGDAAATTLVIPSKGGKAAVTLRTDGQGAAHIMIRAGGYRHPSSVETMKVRVQRDGGMRSDEHGTMNGKAVFQFAVREVPRDIQRVCKLAGIDPEAVRLCVMHQANRHMLEHIAKKASIDTSALLFSLEEYGNTSSVSIPLTISHNAGRIANAGEAVQVTLLSGFGVGLSWGSVITSLNSCRVLPPLEVKDAE